MPKYRFEFHENARVEPVTIELADDAAAREEALATAAASTWDAFVEGEDASQWMTRYYGEAGYLIGTITFADVLERNRQRAGKQPNETEAVAIRSG